MPYEQEKIEQYKKDGFEFIGIDSKRNYCLRRITKMGYGRDGEVVKLPEVLR
jgi:hypothetical protein